MTGGRIRQLYVDYAEDLHRIRAELREFLESRSRGFSAQLDDIEAEITYLLLRESRPELVLELGSLHGWSTNWILRALRDNEYGVLRSYDAGAHVTQNVSDALAERWRFTQGDIRKTLTELPPETGYLFIDADHGARFARWFVAALLEPRSLPMQVSVHDVFHGRFAKPFSEGKVVLDWLAARGTPWFTASRARARAEFDQFRALRTELGLGPDLKASKANPMLYFTLS